MARGLVDWRLAERVARRVGGGGPSAAREPDAAALAAICADSFERVCELTGLRPDQGPPRPEPVGRGEWSRNALATLAAAAAPVERRLGADPGLPGPLGGFVRAALGAAAGTEAGVAVGYVSRRVLGQYDVALVGPERPARLLFVIPNMAAARADLGAEVELFWRWVALHETTHAVQFGAVPWLAPRLRELIGELLEAAASRTDTATLSALARRALRTDPRALLRSMLHGELVRLLAGPRERELLDRMQVTMAVIEGHAEHVMDACAAALDPRLPELRERLERRRRGRGGLGDVVGRLLGMELKLRQYRLGKAFCDGVAERTGEAGLACVWSAPEALPSEAELTDPDAWLVRVGAPPLAASGSKRRV